MILKLKNKDTLVFDQFEIKCAIGKKGLNNNKIEGDKTTPKGVFSFGKIYWRKDRVKNLLQNLKIKLLRKICFGVITQKVNFIINKLLQQRVLNQRNYLGKI